MSRYKSQVREVINRHSFVSLALDKGFNAYEPVFDGGIDLILHREADAVAGVSEELHKVQLKGRWTIDKKYVGRGLAVAFPIGDEWYLVPHDEMVRFAMSEGVGDTASWREKGTYNRGRPSRATIASCSAYRFGSPGEVAAAAAAEGIGPNAEPEEPSLENVPQELGGAKAIAAFLPIVDEVDFTAGVWGKSQHLGPNHFTFPPFNTDPRMGALLTTCARHGWLTAQYDQTAIDVVNDRTDGAAELANAGTGRLATVMTFLSRAESHIGGGAFAEAVESGLIRTVVQRAAEIAAVEARTPLTQRDRVLGSILGGAIGDALGAPIEFLSLAKIRDRFGPAGLQDLDDSGQITDDTQLTLFTAEGLIRARMRALSKGMCHPPAVIHHAYLRWLITQGETSRNCAVERNGWLLGVEALHHRRAPGNTCLSALIDAKGFGSPERARNDSKGCGGVMRVAPVGLFAPIIGNDDEVFELGAASAALTHGHPSGFLAAGYLAVVIAALCRGEALDDALDAADRLLAVRDGAGEVARALAAARALARRGKPTPEALETLGGGWVADEALAIAVCCALAADGFDDGVIMAVNHSGDSDSTAAIAGNILGARDGVRTIPAAWFQGLEMRDEIERLALDLVRATGDEELQFDDYPPA